MASKDMSDFDIERLCHEALGYFLDSPSWPTWMLPWHPLVNDDQAMALVKRFFLEIQSPILGQKVDGMNPWGAVFDEGKIFSFYPDLNRSICECVAKMQLSKAGKNAKEEENQDLQRT